MSVRVRSGCREGFALLTVVIVAAVLVVSAMMLAVTVGTETQITKTGALFKTALNVAEEGLDTSLSSIRTQPTVPGSSTAWVAAIDTQVQAVLFPGTKPPQQAVTYVGNTLHGSLRGAYSVQVKVLSTPAPKYVDLTPQVTHPHPGETLTTTTSLGTATVRVMSTGGTYPPSVSAMTSGMSLSSGYAARRAIQTTTVVSYTVQKLTGTTNGGPVPDTYSLDMAILTGGSISISGSAQELHGSVYANGDIYIQKSSGLQDGYAYAAGSVTGNAPAGSQSGVSKRSLPDPGASLPFYQAMFTAYCNGTYPYDGTNGAYTNMNSSTPAGQANRTKYNVAGLIANPANYSLYTDPTAVYYVNGPLHITSGVSLTGTIMVKGDIFISGNITVAAGSSLPAIIATGNVKKDAGCSYIKGVIVAGGSFTGRGTSDIYGAIISADSVDMKGNFTVTYDPTLTTFTGGGTVVPPGTYTGTPTYTLNDLALPAPADRTWQEVNPS